MDLPKGLSPSWLEQFCRERGQETFRRMSLLEQRGFYRETKRSLQPDGITYEPYANHLPSIILYPDGKIVGIRTKGHPINPNGSEGERDRIYNFDDEDVRLFDEWIAQIRMPNPWQKLKKFREDVRAWGCLIVLFGTAYLIVSILVDFAARVLGLLR